MKDSDAEEGFRVFRNVVRSLMKDASRVAAEADPEEGPGDLRERLHLVAHYIDYTLRYCTDCPLISDEPGVGEFRPFRTIEFPGAS